MFYAGAQNKIDPKSISPNCFIINNGQWPGEVAFLARSCGLNAWILKNGGVVYDFFRITDSTLNNDPFHNRFKTFPDSANKKRIKGHVIRMDFENGNLSSGINKEGKNKQSYYYNFIIGRDTTKWASFVGAFGEVVLANIYKGIDIRYYFEKGMLCYDFIVHTGADPAKIKMQFTGQEKLSISENGELEFVTNLGLVTHQKLSARQKEKTNVSCSFRTFAENEVGFYILGYNPSSELIIDPLVYSTYLGGNSSDKIYGIVTDKIGCAIVTGETGSLNFPTTIGAYDTVRKTSTVSFITKFNNSGINLIFSTFIGGTSYDYINCLTLDQLGNIYLGVGSMSKDFPVTPGVYDTSYNGNGDIVICKMNPTGSTLLKSTYIGGSYDEHPSSIIIDNQGNVNISGSSSSSNYPVTSGCYNSYNNGSNDIVLSKLNANFNSFIYSTFIGGSDVDDNFAGSSMLIEPNGSIILTGLTSSANFPVTPGAYSTYKGGKDAFLLKMNNTGSALIFSTLIGTTGEESGWSVCKSGNNIIIAGITNSANFPVTAGSYNTSINGEYDVFIAKFDSLGKNLLKSTYIGGGLRDVISTMFNDPLGNLVLIGTTESANYPVSSSAYDISYNGLKDLFISVLNSDLSIIKYSTFIGAYADDIANAGFVDENGFIYVAGCTESNIFPVSQNAFDTAFNYDSVGPWIYDGILLKFSPCSIKIDTVTGGGSWCMGTPGLSITLSGSQIGVKYSLYRNGVSTSSVIWGSGNPFTFGNMTIPGVYTVLAYDSAAKCSQLMAGSATIKTIPELYNVTGGGYHCQGDSGLTVGLDSSEIGVEYELIQDSIPTGKKIIGTGKALSWPNNPKGIYEIHAFAKFGCNGRMSGAAIISDFIKPAAKFTVNDSIQCQGKNSFVFTNNSKVQVGGLKYIWHFGDGQSSSSTDTVHSYKNYDTFRVALFAYSDHNCIDSSIKNMVVYFSPKALYTVSDTISCIRGTYFNFYDKSSVPYGSYTRFWNFGDNVISAQQNPSHGYGSYDSFKAKLTVTSFLGCKDSFSRYIFIVPVPKASFTLTDSVQCLGSNSFAFKNTSKTSFGSLVYIWNFGDGNNSNGKHPVYSYLSAGTYKVNLIATAGSTCLDSFSSNVYVSPGPVAAIGVNDTSQCLVNNYFVFDDLSKITGGNITSISWRLGDGTTTASPNPPHSYHTADSFNVQLTVNADIGCNDSTILKVYVRPMPVAGFKMNANPQNLLLNNFIFTNSSSVKYGNLVSDWDFGDGNTSILTNPTHSYALADSFIVKLVATSEYGCTDTFTDLAYVTTRIVNASFSVGITCAGDSAFFQNTSTVIAPDSLKNTLWNFGDTTVTFVGNNPSHLFKYSGTYQVIMEILTTKGNTDWDTQLVSVLPKPKVLITYTPDTVAVIGELITLTATGNYDALLWDNGSVTPSITINKTGKYWVTASYNTGCYSTDTIKLRFIEKTLLHIVNTITPNGDGINDYFKILNIDLFSPCKINIFNRWGDELFSASDYQNNWDGRYKGKTLPEGTYYYLIQDRGGMVYKGAVNILK